jgi:hypothetical protein
MTKDEWVDVCGEALEAGGIEHFQPLEIADVGREAHLVDLEAPQPRLIPNALKLCRVLCDLRAAVRPAPVLVNSWYRSRLYNYRIGGVSNSMHLTCGAADVTKPGFTPDEVADILEDHPDSDQFGIGRYRTFTHIDIRGMLGRSAPARWSL